MTTADKYYWVINHPAFINRDMIDVEIDIQPHNVCPLTDRIEDFAPLNTRCDYWVEVCVGVYFEEDDKYHSSHMTNLNCGGKSYDAAVDKLHSLVLQIYGDYTEEEWNKKIDETYSHIQLASPTVQSLFNSTITTIIQDVQPLHHLEYVSIQYQIEDLTKYIYALTEYLKLCTIDERPKAEKALEEAKYELFCNEKSIEWSMDFR